MNNKKFGVAVKGFIFKSEKLLVIYKTKEEAASDPNPSLRIDTPGGRVEFGEDPYTALAREINEEVNLKVDIISPFEVWSYVKEDFELVGINFLCNWVSGEIQLSNEHEGYKWITCEDIKDSNYPNRNMYYKALDLYKKLK